MSVCRSDLVKLPICVCSQLGLMDPRAKKAAYKMTDTCGVKKATKAAHSREVTGAPRQGTAQLCLHSMRFQHLIQWTLEHLGNDDLEMIKTKSFSRSHPPQRLFHQLTYLPT